jgi:hypothetical protein
MRLYLSSLLLLTACGSDSGGRALPSDGAVIADGPDIDDAPNDTAALPACDVTADFLPPEPIPGASSTSNDIQATLIDDQTLYFTSDRAGATGAYDLWTATRATPADAWTDAAALGGFDTAAIEVGAYLTGNQKKMFYAVGSPAEIYLATRASAMVGFSSGAPVDAVNDSTYDDGDVSVTADGGLMYFASNRNTANGYDIYVSVRSGNDDYGDPEPVTEVNTTVQDAHPRISPDGLTLYWSSMRTDGGAEGGNDIWMATRASVDDDFSGVTRVDALSTASNESPTWVSADGCAVYLQSNRTGTMGGQDLWEAKKPEL